MTIQSQFSGLRNQQNPKRLPFGSLKVATNVIFDATRALESRFGYERQLTLTDLTDGFSPDHYQYAYVVDNGTLYAVLPDLSLLTITSGLVDGVYQWAQQGDRTFYAGASECGMIQGVSKWLPLRLPYPTPSSITQVTGTLPEGQYQVTGVLRHIDSHIESPAHGSVSVTSNGSQAISIEYVIPASYEADVYVTEPNDTQERYYVTLASGGRTIFDNNGIRHLGNYLEAAQTLTDVLPTASITALAMHNKCLYAALYDPATNLGTVIWSQPGWPQVYRLIQETPTDPPPDLVAFQGKVLGMATSPEGLLVGTDRAIWLLNAEGIQQRLRNYGVILGRPFARSNDGMIVINSQRGVMVYANGQLLDGTTKFIPPKSSTGSISLVDYHGLRFSLTLTDGLGRAYNQY